MGTWIMGVAPCSFPIIQKGRKDGGGRMMGARRPLESLFATRLELGRGEEHTRRARTRTIIISCPLRTSRFVASWADLRGVSTAIHDEWIGLVQQGN